jgi:hypothetical protein
MTIRPKAKISQARRAPVGRAKRGRESHLLFGLYLGAVVWGGLFLRDAKLREIIPLRRFCNAGVANAKRASSFSAPTSSRRQFRLVNGVVSKSPKGRSPQGKSVLIHEFGGSVSGKSASGHERGGAGAPEASIFNFDSSRGCGCIAVWRPFRSRGIGLADKYRGAVASVLYLRLHARANQHSIFNDKATALVSSG